MPAKSAACSAQRIADFKGITVEQAPVEALPTLDAELKLDLRSRGYKDKTVRTCVHYANLLLAQASELGLIRRSPCFWAGFSH